MHNTSTTAGASHVKGILAHGMYDSDNNFKYLSSNHLKPGIKTRRNSKVRPTNYQARNMSILRQQAYFKSAEWIMSTDGWQTAFSFIKRMFGEHVRARKFFNMVKEIFLKATHYNMFNRMAES